MCAHTASARIIWSSSLTPSGPQVDGTTIQVWSTSRVSSGVSWCPAAFLQETQATSEHRMTVSLSAVDMSSVVPAAEADTASSPFECGVSVLLDHTYLPTGFGCLTENALVYIAGFVVRQVMKQLSCDVCRNSLVCEAVPASFCESYHLLTLKNKGGLMIPSKGAVKVIRAAEHCIRRVCLCRHCGL